MTALPFRPAAVNRAGQVAGTDSRHRAVLWTRGGLAELPLPGGFEISDAVAINDQGEVLAVAYDRANTRHRAFTVSKGRISLLEAEQSLGRKISRTGEIVGEAVLPGQPQPQPVAWIDGRPRSLGGCCGGSARDVNARGEVIGDAYDAKGRYHAFLWTSSDGLRTIGPPDQFSSAVAINDAGTAVIQVLTRSYVYAGGSLTQLKLSPKYPSHPRAVNTCGVIVGSFGPFADADRAFAWEHVSGFIDLNDRIAADSGWTLQAAVAINDAGMIIGYGDSRDQDDAGFLLVPAT